MGTSHNLSLADARILIVDDQVANIQVLEGLLRRMGLANVHSLTSGRDALEGCGSWQPDLILLDLHMPEVDGFEVLRRLTREPAYAAMGAATPVILLTARADFTARSHGWEEYANEYVTKPFNLDELARTVQNLLSRSGKIHAR